MLNEVGRPKRETSIDFDRMIAMAKDKNHEKAIAALISTTSITDAAKKCRLSEPTLYRYLQDEAFKREYRNARRNVVESAVGQIQSATSEAVSTLKRNMSCEHPSTEVRAAQIILDTAYKGVEMLDILERLERLENEHQRQY